MIANLTLQIENQPGFTLMNYSQAPAIQDQLAQATKEIYQEHQQLLKSVNFEQLDNLITEINSSNKIFLMGMGRSGLMMKAAAMRLMHLGFDAYVVGETTTPAIAEDDLLITGSGSGSTKSIVRAAKTAKEAGAKNICFTAVRTSQLAQLSDHIIFIPAQQKQELNTQLSAQYAGSLFEQALLMFFDAAIQVLWKSGGSSSAELWQRHANLE